MEQNIDPNLQPNLLKTTIKFPIWAIVLISILVSGLVIGSLIYYFTKPNQQTVQGNEQTQTSFEPSRVNYAYVDNASGHIIYNGKDLGTGQVPIVLDGNDIAFTDSNRHLIYNGQNLGEYTPDSKEGGGQFWPPILNSGHIAFYRTINNKLHLIYDGKDKGNVFAILDGNNIAFRTDSNDITFTSSNNHVIYNGKDLGIGYNLVLADNHLAYMTLPDIPAHIIYDGKDLGQGYNPMIYGNSFGYVSQTNGTDHIIFNGKDFGEGGYPCDMNEYHIACVRNIGDGFNPENHVIYDGKDLGIGNYPHLDGDNIAYDNLGSSDDFSIKYNGKVIGQGFHLVMNNGNYAFEKARDKNTKKINEIDYAYTPVIYNGKELEAGTGIQLLDNNLAYIITTGDKNQTIFDGKTIDGVGFVMSEKK